MHGYMIRFALASVSVIILTALIAIASRKRPSEVDVYWPEEAIMENMYWNGGRPLD
jgi:hypothetical protein